jgi:prevent-host-death family protein
MTVLKQVSATELNRRSGEIIKRVALHGEHVLIDRDGYPLAVIIPVHEYNAKHQPTKEADTSLQK